MAITISEVEFLLISEYNISGDVTQLDGDLDFNFKVKSPEQTHLVKICDIGTSKEVVEFQLDLLSYIGKQSLPFLVPSIKFSVDGSAYLLYEFASGKMYVRVHTWVEGNLLNDINPRTNELYVSWGKTCGLLSSALAGFDHMYAHRFDKWNPKESLWSRQYIDYFEDARKSLANHFWDYFETTIPPVLKYLRSGVNYSDANEHNLLVDDHKKVSGVIDFGDAVYGPTVREVAIACAYAAMHVEDPVEAMAYVVEGYHKVLPLQEKEIEILFAMICGRLMITVANAAYRKSKEPDNIYSQVSAEPAWKLLEKLRLIDHNFIHYYFRSRCNLEPCPNRIKWDQWYEFNKDVVRSPIDMSKHTVMEMDLNKSSFKLSDNGSFADTDLFCQVIDMMLMDQKASLGIGGYCEIRPFYITDAYKVEGNNGPRWRDMHLGTDYWVDSGEDVFALYDGKIHSFQNNDNPCDYGPTIILEHQTGSGFKFYSLYGHLSEDSLDGLSIGYKVSTGQKIAQVGSKDINGNWPPHLHFQVMLDMLGWAGDFPGVCFTEEAKIWSSICPNVLY